MKNNNDVFADIAENAFVSSRDELTENLPAKLPEKYLSGMVKGSAHCFDMPNSDLEGFGIDKKTSQLRSKYQKFLKDVSPVSKSLRKRKDISKFDWRLETERDRRDISYTIAGKGKWQQIKIPHYEGPLGKAVTYYRCKFNIPKNWLKKKLCVRFNGVDYKSKVYVNSNCVGSHEGFFAPHEFDFTDCAVKGENVLTVQVENDAICMGNKSWGEDGHLYEGDKLYAASGPGYDDPDVGWHHCPPGMGIYQEVYLEARSSVFIDDVFVRPLIDQNKIELSADVLNACALRKKIALKVSIFGQNFKKQVLRGKEFAVEPAGPGKNYYKFYLDVKDFRKWTPDSPWLYKIVVSVEADGRSVDVIEKQFGMRSFVQDVHSEPKGQFYLNNEKIHLRGANTMGHLQQCVMNNDYDRLIDDILLAKVCNLNFLRLTQRPVQRQIYDYCDRLGMLTQTDLPLFAFLRRSQFCEALRQCEEMEHLIRSHPCNIMVTYMNEPLNDEMTPSHRQLNRKELESFFEAADQVIRLQNPDRVIKAVDGDYFPPGPGMPDNHCYCGWYNGHALDIGKLHKGYWVDTKKGWYYGCGEFGSEGLENPQLMRKYYPPDWLKCEKDQKWSPSKVVKAQTADFYHMWFDKQDSIEDWVNVSQKHQAWATKIITESFRRDSKMKSFALHLLIDAFPAGWMKSVVDFQRGPKPAFYEYMKALTPVFLNIRSDRNKFFSEENFSVEFWICNDTKLGGDDFKLKYYLTQNDAVLSSGCCKASFDEFESNFIGHLKIKAPKVDERSELKIKAGLFDKDDKLISSYVHEIEVFPVDKLKVPTEAFFIRQGNSACKYIMDVFEMKHSKNANLILIDDFGKFKKDRQAVIQSVKSGSTAVFLNLPAGKYKIKNIALKIEKCKMNPVNFVSCKTTNEVAQNFHAEDFKFWYDESAGYVTPLLDSYIKSEKLNPVLLHKDSDISDEAVGECEFGKGKFVFCQVLIKDRLKTNPTAKSFLTRLFSA